MWKWPLLLPGLALAVAAGGQTAAPGVELANMREDVRGLSQRVADLALRVEQLEAENGALRDKVRSGGEAYATVAQLNEAVAELNRVIQASAAAAKDETLRQVAAQMERLARQTNAALDSLGRSQTVRPSSATFSEEFPKQGVTYAVQKGDTLALIAKKTGAKVQDIINANKIADPARILVGQSLFIPGGK